MAKTALDLFVDRLLATSQSKTREKEPTKPALVDASPSFFDDAREDPVTEAQAWLCPHCGQPATIDDVFPSLDGERTLTMWRCDPCQVVAVTPDAIKEPPSGWVRRTEQ